MYGEIRIIRIKQTSNTFVWVACPSAVSQAVSGKKALYDLFEDFCSNNLQSFMVFSVWKYSQAK